MKKLLIFLMLTLVAPTTSAMDPNVQATQASYVFEEEDWGQTETAHASANWGDWTNVDSNPNHEEKSVLTAFKIPQPEQLYPEEQQAHANREVKHLLDQSFKKPDCCFALNQIIALSK